MIWKTWCSNSSLQYVGCLDGLGTQTVVTYIETVNLNAIEALQDIAAVLIYRVN
jgi:hypothetical protein